MRTFPEYGAAQSTINAIEGHAGGSVPWTGPLAARPEDMTGIAAQYAHLSSQARLPHRYELALESFYRCQITGWAMLTPDLQ